MKRDWAPQAAPGQLRAARVAPLEATSEAACTTAHQLQHQQQPKAIHSVALSFASSFPFDTHTQQDNFISSKLFPRFLSLSSLCLLSSSSSLCLLCALGHLCIATPGVEDLLLAEAISLLYLSHFLPAIEPVQLLPQAIHNLESPLLQRRTLIEI
jgi:hypothetical protein